MMATRLTGQDQFRRVGTLFISKQESDCAKSMELLAANGLRLITYQEALSRFSSIVVKELRGEWFYLAGKGIQGNGVRTFNERGELVRPTGRENDNQRVYVWSGSQQLKMGIYLDGNVPRLHRRFSISGMSDLDPTDNIARVVVGTFIDTTETLAQARAALTRLKRDVRG